MDNGKMIYCKSYAFNCKNCKQDKCFDSRGKYEELENTKVKNIGLRLKLNLGFANGYNQQELEQFEDDISNLIQTKYSDVYIFLNGKTEFIDSDDEEIKL